MSDSPIVDEVRRRAMEISARFNHDLDRYVEHLHEYQKQFRDRLVNQITVVPGCPPTTGSSKNKQHAASD